MKKLIETIGLMCSSDYRDRFVAEYAQLQVRTVKLGDFIHSIETARVVGDPEPEHDCPLELLLEQREAMVRYLEILRKRARIEGIRKEALR